MFFISFLAFFCLFDFSVKKGCEAIRGAFFGGTEGISRFHLPFCALLLHELQHFRRFLWSFCLFCLLLFLVELLGFVEASDTEERDLFAAGGHGLLVELLGFFEASDTEERDLFDGRGLLVELLGFVEHGDADERNLFEGFRRLYRCRFLGRSSRWAGDNAPVSDASAPVVTLSIAVGTAAVGHHRYPEDILQSGAGGAAGQSGHFECY